MVINPTLVYFWSVSTQPTCSPICQHPEGLCSSGQKVAPRAEMTNNNYGFQKLQHNQVISHQVITGEQGKKYCETLLAPFERHDSEFSGGVPIRKQIMTVLGPGYTDTFFI